MELSQHLIQALNNNLRWCQTVAQLHNIPHETQASLWQSQQAMPTFFPNLVTLSPELTTDKLQNVLPQSGSYFIKDSFATMKLEGDEFIKLFDAQWYCAPALLDNGKQQSGIEITEVIDAEQLKQWESLWRGEETFDRIYTNAFLDNEATRFFTVSDGEEIAGITSFFDGQSIGIYNLWGNAKLLPELINHIKPLYPSSMIVGYGDEEEVKRLQGIGFEALEPLSVWGRF